jgi:hypothetical protein
MAQSTPAAATALPIEPVWDPHTPSIAIDPANNMSNQSDRGDEEDLDSSWGGDMSVF